MPSIKLAGFRGEQPHIIPRMLPESAAQQAFNCRLDNGGLTPTRRPVFYDDAGGIDHKTIVLFDDEWLSWSDLVHAVEGPVDDTRLYVTGDGAPKLIHDGDTYDLALEGPTGALTATPSGAGTGDVIDRVYVYTWVTDFGEESEPNVASDALEWQDGITVTLSGFAMHAGGRNVTKQRIYRSQTGQLGTQLYFIAERADTASDYVDTVPVDGFAEPLPSVDWNPPPDTLTGLVSMANGMMAAFDGRKVYFCEPWRPHAWPEKYILTTDANIVGLAAIDTTLFILTETNPHYAQGATPDTMQMVKWSKPLPCINARGIVNLGNKIAYPSNDGLAVALPGASFGLASAALFDRDGWRRYDPATIIAGEHGGRYVAFYDTTTDDGVILAGSMIISLDGDPFLSRSTEQVSAVYSEPKGGGLYYIPKGTDDIMRFDDPDGAMQSLYWRSKPFKLPYPENFGVVQVDTDLDQQDDAAAAAEAYRLSVIAANQAAILAGTVTSGINSAVLNGLELNGDDLTPLPVASGLVAVGIYADGVRVATIELTNEPKRFAGGFKARQWEIDVTGDVPVTQIVLGKTMDDIKATA